MTNDNSPPVFERLMTASEVGTALRVDPKTVTRWAQTGKLDSARTPGGHHRFREADVRALMNGSRS